MSTTELPIALPLTIRQGATFRKQLRWSTAGVPVDLSGWTARMQVRRFRGAVELLLELTSDDGAIVLDADGGIMLELEAEETTTLAPTRGVYDLLLADPDGDTLPFLAGRMTVVEAVTQPPASP